MELLWLVLCLYGHCHASFCTNCCQDRYDLLASTCFDVGEVCLYPWLSALLLLLWVIVCSSFALSADRTPCPVRKGVLGCVPSFLVVLVALTLGLPSLLLLVVSLVHHPQCTRTCSWCLLRSSLILSIVGSIAGCLLLSNHPRTNILSPHLLAWWLFALLVKVLSHLGHCHLVVEHRVPCVEHCGLFSTNALLCTYSRGWIVPFVVVELIVTLLVTLAVCQWVVATLLVV